MMRPNFRGVFLIFVGLNSALADDCVRSPVDPVGGLKSISSFVKFGFENPAAIPFSEPDLQTVCESRPKPSAEQKSIGERVKALYARWKAPEKREASVQKFFADILGILGSLSEGRSVIACWDALPNGKKVILMKSEKRKQAAAAFFAHYDNPETQNISTEIHINPEVDIYWSVSAIAHELKHACDYKDQAEKNRIIDNFSYGYRGTVRLSSKVKPMSKAELAKKEKETANKLKIARLEAIHGAVLSEMRAHSSQAELFKQLTLLDPEFFCGLRDKETYAKREKDIRSGNYPLEQLNQYVGIKEYLPGEVFEIGKDGKPRLNQAGKRVIQVSLVQKLKMGGFPVAQSNP